jgi:hypothetical protein
MLWAALVLAGVVVGLILGALPYALWNRRRARRIPGSFACKIRQVGPLLAAPRNPPTGPVAAPDRAPLSGRRTAVRSRSPGATGRARFRYARVLAPPRRRHGRPAWGRFPYLVATAWWVNDVLAVESGWGLGRTRLLPVAAADSVRPVGGGGVRGLGPSPRSVLLIVGDGRLVEVAVAREHARRLAGPVVSRIPAQRN